MGHEPTGADSGTHTDTAEASVALPDPGGAGQVAAGSTGGRSVYRAARSIYRLVRSAGLRLWLFAQNFGQIEHSYKNAKGLIENCLVRTYMNPTRESAITIAEDIGQAGIAAGADEQSSVSPQELAGHNFKSLQIVIGASSKPAKVRKMPYYDNPELNSRKGSLEDVAPPSAGTSSAVAAL